MKHPLAKIQDIPDKGSKIVDFFGRSAHVYKRGGKLTAVANTCMHFGGPLDYHSENGDAAKFVCQWHNAEFGSNGECLKGPAPSSSKLMFISTVVEDDTIYYVWGE